MDGFARTSRTCLGLGLCWDLDGSLHCICDRLMERLIRSVMLRAANAESCGILLFVIRTPAVRMRREPDLHYNSLQCSHTLQGQSIAPHAQEQVCVFSKDTGASAERVYRRLPLAQTWSGLEQNSLRRHLGVYCIAA